MTRLSVANGPFVVTVPLAVHELAEDGTMNDGRLHGPVRGCWAIECVPHQPSWNMRAREATRARMLSGPPDLIGLSLNLSPRSSTEQRLMVCGGAVW
jgi:hypothetical protein